MFLEKNIVVTIGNYGTIIAIHEGNDIKSKLFVDDLNDETKPQVEEVFKKNKLAPIYILIDTIDQSYKKKIYPHVKKADLVRIANRDMHSDGDSDSLKNYMILNQKKSAQAKSGNKWECLFVSSPASDIINNWVEFLTDTPNRVVGIYMLPVESYNLFNSIKNGIKSQSKVKDKKNNLYCLIMQNKVSGTRQIVFSEGGVVFTRVVNYDFNDTNLLEKYEQDIYSTFEYLKRLYPTLTISELEVVNILPQETLDKINKIENIELNFINYTPFQVAIDSGNKVLSQNSTFCDLLISKSFSKGKKILKFNTQKIKILEKYFLTLQFSYYFNLFLALIISASIFFTVYNKTSINESILDIENNKFNTLEKSQSLKIKALNASSSSELSEKDKSLTFEQIADFGKMNEIFQPIGTNVGEFYLSLNLLKNHNVKLSQFSYNLSSFNPKQPLSSARYTTLIQGDIYNKSGDIENLFTDFDLMVSSVQNKFKDDYIVKYSDLPKNIDFNQKYYSFPINFTISQK